MLFLRCCFLEFLLCFHVVGAAVLFRRLFPRESPWLCYLVPVVALLSCLNFIEHFVPLPNLGWLLPFTLAGLACAIFLPGYSWEGLRFPTVLFLLVFTFMFAVRCLRPSISNGNEGIFNMTRILGYALGGVVPPKDTFLPPYDYGGYYTFQHYGAAILKRLFSTDLGTAYNVSFAFVLAWMGLMTAGVAHALTNKIWISVATLVVVMAASSGSVPIIALFGPNGFDYDLSTAVNDDWDKADHNPFHDFAVHDAAHPMLLLEPPMVNLYWSEYHSTMGGNFVTIATMLAACLVFRTERSNWPWICLAAFPLLIIVTSAWFFPIVFIFCFGSAGLAWLAGHRPRDLHFAVAASVCLIIFLWPSAYAVTGISTPENFHWTDPEERTPLWLFLVQWWPVFIPWLLLCFKWRRLDLRARWFHAALPLIFIGLEIFTFADRKLTTEKMWAGTYGIAQVTMLPLLFMQTRLSLRFASWVLILNGLICLGLNLHDCYPDPFGQDDKFRLQGDSWVQEDSQKKRLLQAMQQLHGAVILPGKSYWNYSQAAGVVSFSENQCYVAYTFNEFHYGRGGDADYRSKINNAFYDGANPDPLAFLAGNHIDAVLIWPEDGISDMLLEKFKHQLGPEFFYIDCKMDGTDNAGLFVRQSKLTVASAYPVHPL